MGLNAISNGGNSSNRWRTLTRNEWYFLLFRRTNADKLQGQATVNGVHGYVLFPDGFVVSARLSFTESPDDWSTNVFTIDEWS